MQVKLATQQIVMEHIQYSQQTVDTCASVCLSMWLAWLYVSVHAD